jgi:hypothetical protein
MDYELIYNRIIRNAVNQKRIKNKDQYYERHHIVPKCLGGTNNKNNLVLLTAKEHFIAHHLLWKIHPDNNKIAYALKCFVDLMDNKHMNRVNKPISAKEYNRLKALGKTICVEQGNRSYSLRIGIHSLDKEQLSKTGKENGKKAFAEKRFKPETGGAAGAKLGTSKKNFQIADKVRATRAEELFYSTLVSLGFDKDYKINKKEAKLHGLKKYYGNACNKHPELGGIRKTGGGKCPSCNKEWLQKARATGRVTY